MNAKVISIGDRRPESMYTASAAAPAVEGDIERARLALGSGFGGLRSRGVLRGIEHYLAQDARGEIVELRVLSARATSDVRARELFYLEAYAASKLAHVNVVTTSGPEQARGVDFFVIEHKRDARTLKDLLGHNGWMDVKSAAGIADQVASALEHAHQSGVLHLRLQPECILIEPDGWVTLADFGIDARRGSGSLRRPRAPYASPEQAMGNLVDRSSDLYSLGAVLYEMLTDRTPFDSNDADHVRRKQMSLAPSPPHRISMDVPEPVSAVVMRLLEREPGKRFASAAAFQKALDDAISCAN